MSINKRKRDRVDYVIEIKIKIDDIWQDSSCQNISMSGALLMVEGEFIEGDMGAIDIIHTFGDEQIKVMTEFKIIRVNETDNKTNIAIEFTKLDTDSSINLYNIIRYQS